MNRFAFRAPGRVNLIGEHTDYNGGFVLPAAINLYTTAIAEAVDEPTLSIHSANFSETREFAIDDETARRDWTDYPRGVYVMLRRSGAKLAGTKLLVKGDVPLGAGLSSSASIEVAVAAALLASVGERMASKELALLCQQAENEFAGARCGIMDQFVAAHAIAGHALQLDCENLAYTPAPIPQGISLVIANTMVKHGLSGGEYNQRRAECESAARKLGVATLRHATMPMLARAELMPTEWRRARHNITENARVHDFVRASEENDLKAMGKAMAASHASLRDDFAVSCPELDAMVEAAQSLPGFVGARMTGGGFGGCTINLVITESGAGFARLLEEAYRQRTGITPQIILSEASGGVTSCST